MTNYRRGYNLERRVRSRLEHDGYIVVRSAGSKTKIDLAAFKPRQTLFVQVKSADISHDEWNALFDLAVSVQAIPVLAETEKRKLVFRRLVGLHLPRSHNWPSIPFHTDEVEEAS